MSLDYYKSLAMEHWQEFLPKRWKELQEAGRLGEAIDEAAERTDREMQAQLGAGVPRNQAWEELRGRYLLLEPESEPQSPQSDAHDLIREIHAATMDIYDDL